MERKFKPVKVVLFDLDGLVLSKTKELLTDDENFIPKNVFRYRSSVRKGFPRVVREIWKQIDDGGAREASRVVGKESLRLLRCKSSAKSFAGSVLRWIPRAFPTAVGDRWVSTRGSSADSTSSRSSDSDLRRIRKQRWEHSSQDEEAPGSFRVVPSHHKGNRPRRRSA